MLLRSRKWRWSVVLISLALTTSLPAVKTYEINNAANQQKVHSRQKRIMWVTNDGRLALPPGTTVTMTTGISMPFVRHPPPGFLANITLNFPITIEFDKLGLTDNENPYGTIPSFERSFGRSAGSLVADYLGQYLAKRRGKRALPSSSFPAQLENFILDRMHGGERVLLYSFAEDVLTQMGLPGHQCMLRAICEVHVHPLRNFGFFGEVIKLFFTPSMSPYAHLLSEYTTAQRTGQEKGECFDYFRDCNRSIFLPATNKYTKEAEEQHRRDDEEIETNEIKSM